MVKVKTLLCWNTYNPNQNYQLNVYEVDDANELPAMIQTDYIIAQGSKAHVIADNSWYAIQSNGAWKIQTMGTAGYTKAEVDQMITDTETYADNAVSTAINALDVSSVGGATRYIYQISETNGKISASSYASDSAPTAGSTKLVQSGGVKTAIDAAKTAANSYTDTKVATKASINEIYGIGKLIESGTDLNDLTTAGVYTCTTVTIANTLTNVPFAGSAFRLEVKCLNNSTRIRQECYILSDTSSYYARTYTSTGWKSWYMFSGTPVTP